MMNLSATDFYFWFCCKRQKFDPVKYNNVVNNGGGIVDK